MPNSIIAEGKTTNEAIENGLKKLKVSKNQVTIKVLENEEKRSFFSILEPRVVKVELTLNENNNVEEALKNEKEKREKIHQKEKTKYTESELEIAENNIREFLDKILPQLGEDSKYEINSNEDGVNVSISGESTNCLIGYRGDTLYAVQNILISTASKGLQNRVRVILDIAGYKDKRQKTLEDLADRMERNVIRTGKSITLEPMKAYERKIIHSRLQNSSKVTTISIGEEPRRRIVISLK